MRSVRGRPAILLALVILWCPTVIRAAGLSAAIPAVAAPGDFKLDGDTREWIKFPPNLRLTSTAAGARDGVVWVGQSDDGLIVAGKVTGGSARWPKVVDDMAASDHVEVWLADARAPEFPPVGWRHQWEDEPTLASADDCAKYGDKQDSKEPCREWYGRQVEYRRTLRRLFLRQWQAAPALVVETYATPAYEKLSKPADADVRLLRPSGKPEVAFRTIPDGGYHFELLVPWSAFPPVRPLALSEVRVLVDVFSPGAGPLHYGPYATTSPGHGYGNELSFNSVTLAAPREYYLTPCGYDGKALAILGGPKRAVLIPSEHAVTYLIPDRDLDIRSLVVMDNYARGYQVMPEPTTRSPVALRAEFFARSIGDDETVCGPYLAFARGGKATISNFLVDFPEGLQTRVLQNGNVLIKDGPRVWYSYFGSGQCGGCPRASLGLYQVRVSDRGITRILNQLGVAEDPELPEVDMEVSADWLKATIVEATTDHAGDGSNRIWTTTSYCFSPERSNYQVCGKTISPEPPSTRHLQFDAE